jgi:hypothetical protein
LGSDTKVSDVLAASAFNVDAEDGGSMYIRNVGDTVHIQLARRFENGFKVKCFFLREFPPKILYILFVGILYRVK